MWFRELSIWETVLWRIVCRGTFNQENVFKELFVEEMFVGETSAGEMSVGELPLNLSFSY